MSAVGDVQVDALEAIDARFRSGNSIPVERASVPREEWERLKSALAATGKQQVAEYQYRFWNDEMPGWSSWQPISKSDYERELVEPFEGREVRALYAAPPAQGIDLGQFRKVAEFVLMYAEEKGLYGRVELAQRLLDLIDDQRDAAPGVKS